MKTSYSPVADLIAAARGLIAAPNDPVAQQVMQTALRGIDEVSQDQEAYAGEIHKAREQYAEGSDNTIEIDDDPMLSVGDDGIWVGAWVWVPTDNDDED